MPQPPESPTPDGPGVPDGLRRALEERYDLLGEIGSGGSATVLLAEDRKHRRRVAVKVLHQPLTLGTGAERFRREIAIAARLNHPLIVPLHDSGVADGTPYYVMPFVEGRTLRDRLAGGDPLTVGDALSLARDVAEALDYAHRMGVVHRDIKPSNILLTSGHALVSDFGIAHALEAATVEDLTVTRGASVGTPAYMSPEQALGDQAVDGRSDVYSLGCVVFEMLTGERPYRARSPAAMMVRHLHDAPASLPLERGITPGMAAAVARALSKDPDERFDSAGAFVDALGPGAPAAGRAAPGRPLRRRWRAAATIAAAAVVALSAWWLRPRPAALTGRPASVVVVPFATPEATEDERMVAVDLAGRIATEIDQWDSIYAVPRIALAGPMFDLGIEGPTVTRLDRGLELAEALGVEAMLAVVVEGLDDEASVETTLYDVGTGRRVPRPMAAPAPAGDEATLRRIVFAVLDLDDPGTDANARLRSSNPEAVRAFTRGNRALERWALAEARAAFEESIERDPGFAMAYHRLAQTLYWDAGSDVGALRRVAGEIGRLSADALRAAGPLVVQDSLHLRAFHAFQSGSYEEARRLYTRLLQDHPTDVYALLMLGSTEYWDPWLEETDGGVRPRADLDAAVRTFEEALRLQPTFELGYGHLFDIHRWLTRAAYLGGCEGFERPRDEVLAPWDPREPDRQLSFCPVVRDSIEWLPAAEFRALDGAQVRAGADRLFENSLRMLRRWVSFAPDQAKPLEELADALIERRLIMGRASPSELGSLAREAREATLDRLAILGDTSPADAALLANLHLASGEPDLGVALLDRFQDGSPEPLPMAAANVWLATGRIGAALDMLPRPDFRLFVEDPAGGSLLSFAGAEEVLDRIAILAGLTGPGRPLSTELDRLEDRWRAAGYGEEQRAALRAAATPRILAALAADSVPRPAWAARVEFDDPLWAALIADTEGAARAAAGPALADGGPGQSAMSEPVRAFVAGHVALRLDDPASAARWFSRLDSLSQSARYFQPSWSLRTLGQLWRARALERAGDDDGARRAYSDFLERWKDGDPYVEPLLDEARISLARLADGA